MQQFTFVIKHKSGVTNRVADALSRRENLLTTMRVEVMGFDLLPDLLTSDSYFSGILDKVKQGSMDGYMLVEGFMFRGNQLCIPDCSLRRKIIKELHEEGHVGRDRTM